MNACVPPEPHPAAGLRALFDRVVEAKAEHRRQLGRRKNYARIARTREKTVTALEAYIDALSSYGFPVPPRMRRDLELLRILCGASRPRVRE